MRVLFLLLCAITPAVASAQTFVSSHSTPITAYQGTGDFVWNERQNRTHITLTLENGLASIDLRSVDDLWMDLEIRNLANGHKYGLASSVATTRYDIVTSSGSGYFWNVPSTPATWTLRDTTSNLVVGTIVITDRSTLTSPSSSGTAYVAKPQTCTWTGDGFTCCPDCKGDDNPPPPPPCETCSATTEGLVVWAAAMSYHSEITITVSGCRTHTATISAYVSGGQAAAAGAGGTKSACVEFTSREHPAVLMLPHTFQKDSYRDGSFKIYAKDSPAYAAFGETYLYNDYAYPRGVRRTIEASTAYTFVGEETNARQFQGWLGARAFDVGLGATLESGTSASATTRVEITPDRTTGSTFMLDGEHAGKSFIMAGWKV